MFWRLVFVFMTVKSILSPHVHFNKSQPVGARAYLPECWFSSGVPRDAKGDAFEACDCLWADDLVQLLSPAVARSSSGDVLPPVAAATGGNFSHCLRFTVTGGSWTLIPPFLPAASIRYLSDEPGTVLMDGNLADAVGAMECASRRTVQFLKISSYANSNWSSSQRAIKATLVESLP